MRDGNCGESKHVSRATWKDVAGSGLDTRLSNGKSLRGMECLERHVPAFYIQFTLFNAGFGLII
jgi:hypothetical protein